MTGLELSYELDFKPVSEYGTKVRKLGEGSYGKVYLTTNGKKSYAIKTLDLTKFASKVSKEVAFMVRLDHPNVLSVIDVSLSTERMDIVLPYAKRGTLDEQKNATPQAKKNYAYQLLCGVAYCHSRDVVNRDIKPANTLVTGNDVVKLADFGLAASFVCEGHYQPEKSYTVPYRAPEIFFGGLYSKASDVWATACTIYELYTGKKLFRTPNYTDKEMLQAIFSLYPHPLEDWPGMKDLPSYEEITPDKPRNLSHHVDIVPSLILSQMLRLDPSKRPSASDILKLPYFDEVRKKENEPNEYTCEENLDMRAFYPDETKLTNKDRELGIQQLVLLKDKLHSPTKSMCFACYIFDAVCSKEEGLSLTVLALACLHIASIFCEVYTIPIKELVDVDDVLINKDEVFAADDVEKMVVRVTTLLNYDFVVATADDYILMYMDEYSNFVSAFGTVLLQISYITDVHFKHEEKQIALICLMMGCAAKDENFKHASKLTKHSMEIYDKLLKELGSGFSMSRFASKDLTKEEVNEYTEKLKTNPIKVE